MAESRDYFGAEIEDPGFSFQNSTYAVKEFTEEEVSVIFKALANVEIT